MRVWEPSWSSKSGAHPGMGQSACTWQSRLLVSEKLGYEWMVSYSEAMRWLTKNRQLRSLIGFSS
jgi:hypothetical protein